MNFDYITRGILIGAALGALSVLFGITTSYFISVGFGMFAGLCAGITRSLLDKKKKNSPKNTK